MIKNLNLIFLICTILTVNVFNQNLNYFKTCINKQCFDTRIADTPQMRAKGLMGESNLPEDEGMLFLFPFKSKPGFWMKGTKIPLDILFIDDNDIIVYSVKNAQPCLDKECPVYKPSREITKVLEINGGTSNKLGIKVGQEVQYFIEDE